MSAETQTWLDNNVLVGFTEKRGNAWHYREGTDNHYPGPIPVEDVRRRLFHWKPVEGTITTTYATDDGVTTMEDPTRKAIVRPDTQSVLGVFKTGFTIHDYEDTLIRTVGNIVDDELQIGSAGLLRGGAVAWVQVELPDTIDTPEGVSFRPFLCAATSLDGSLSSTFNRGNQVVVCDNTLAGALSDKQALQIKVKHSRHSVGRITDLREALELVVATGEDFAAEVKALCEVKVSDKQWQQFLTVHLGDKDDMRLTDRSKTIITRKWSELDALWSHDDRVTPWKGTGYGVLAAVNTHAQHVTTVKRTNRAERNALNFITGKTAKIDQSAMTSLLAVVGK